MDTTSWLELRQRGRAPRTVPLHGPRTFGRGDNDPGPDDDHVEIAGDETISLIHLAVERVGPGWFVRALGPTNGVFVNGERIADGAPHRLRSGDEIGVGERTTLVFRSIEPVALDRSRTRAAAPPPELTPTERKVLVQLCLPMMEGDSFTSPAKVPQIAEALYVTQSAVKQHLGRLYQKFDIDESGDRRLRLANEAVQRGVVRRADLEALRRGAEG